MARYVIGDVQGCFDELQDLLALIKFDPNCDQLWFCGDLIARGPKSLETLLFVKSLGPAALTVLGNHDLNFLASYYGYGRITPEDQLSALQQSKELPALVAWLLQQPLIHFDGDEQLLLVHAGLAPEWDIPTALNAARAVELALASDPKLLFSQMYGNTPRMWQDTNSDMAKLRFTINACTRMRYCEDSGALNLKEKGGISDNPSLIPWYQFWTDKPHPQIFFGHWAALLGHSPVADIHALDTGCVWGEALTCYCIESRKRYSVEGYKNRL
jgi:bis(5'-nucleosyl)-tetraphosphatase (symmetrical)